MVFFDDFRRGGGGGGGVEFNFMTFIIHYTLIRLYIKLSWKDIFSRPWSRYKRGT